MPAKKRRLRKRNGIAVALKSFKPKTIPPKKGAKAYRRKTKHPDPAE